MIRLRLHGKSTAKTEESPMFTRVLTGFLPSSRVVHGYLLIDIVNFLSISANSFFPTPDSINRIKGFTGSISILYNKIKGVHGFTGPAGYSPLPPLLLVLVLVLVFSLFPRRAPITF